MNKREAGFSMVEMFIVIFVTGFVLAAGSDMFISALRGYRHQSSIAETRIEGIVGLEILRRDIESAGYGLPWNIPASVQYQEAVNSTAAGYNDSPSDPPRALLCGDNITSDPDLVTGADYLVIKAVTLARNGTCTKWSHLLRTGETATAGTDSADLISSDRVIVISPGAANAENRRTLSAPVSLETGTTLDALKFSEVSGLASTGTGEVRIVYGVAPEDPDSPGQPLRMPFNRADYRVKKRDITIPGRCAGGTGVLVKSIVNHDKGGLSSFPLLDCVADMQIVTRLDANGDGYAETTGNGFFAADAESVRRQLHEIRVFILAHDGQKDPGYMHPASIVHVGTPGYGRDFNFAGSGITDWRNYRWKVYALIVKPLTIRESDYARDK